MLNPTNTDTLRIIANYSYHNGFITPVVVDVLIQEAELYLAVQEELR